MNEAPRFVKTTTLAFGCLALLIAGCTSTSPSKQSTRPSIVDSQAVSSLRWLDSADPQRDLAVALARGDTRFIGVNGYAPLTPGVERSAASRKGVRYLSGTSDAIQSREHLRLNQLASSYAERYNRLLLQRLKQ